MNDNFLIKGPYFINIFLGIITGFLMFIYPAVISYILIILIISYFLYKKAHDSEQPFILYIFYFALFSRLFLVIVTHILSSYYGFGPQSSTFPGMEGGAIIGDDMGIHQRAWALANTVNGKQLSEMQTKILLNFGNYGWSFHVYFLGFLYYLFGIFPILGKCINSLFGALTVVLIYFFSRDLFGIRAAKLASILAALFPTLFFWSITNLKDTIFIFLLTFAIFCYVLFWKSRQIKLFLSLLLLLLLVGLYRSGIIFVLIFTMLIYPFITKKLNYRKVILMGVIALLLLNSNTLYNYRIKNSIKDTVSKIIRKQKGSVGAGGSTYRIYPVRFYYGNYEDSNLVSIREFSISFAKGFIFLMFRPFPWEIDSKAKMIFYPVSILWVVLFPFFVIGLLVSFKQRNKSSSFLILLFLAIVTLLSLTEGNIGTMIRHRDMVTPVYIIYSSLGIINILSRHEELLVNNK